MAWAQAPAYEIPMASVDPQNRNQSHPLISVLLPARNAENTLDDALASLAAQTWPNIEVLVVDDHSTDATPTIVQRWASHDPRFKLLHNKGRGIVAALQTALAHATGEYVARMDADDRALPTRLEQQVTLLMQEPACGLCATHVRDIGEVGEGRRAYSQWLNSMQSHDDVVTNLFVECPLPHPTFLLRRRALDSVGGYREVPWPEDYDLVMRMWLGGWKFALVAQPLLEWRDHPWRLSRTDARYSPDAFRLCKLHYLLRSPYLNSENPLIQWGAGKEGKWWLRHWPFSRRPEAVVEVNPRKIGQRIYGVPVVGPTFLDAPRGRFLVVAVGVRSARDEIRAFLGARGWKEREHYLFVS